MDASRRSHSLRSMQPQARHFRIGRLNPAKRPARPAAEGFDRRQMRRRENTGRQHGEIPHCRFTRTASSHEAGTVFRRAFQQRPALGVDAPHLSQIEDDGARTGRRLSGDPGRFNGLRGRRCEISSQLNSQGLRAVVQVNGQHLSWKMPNPGSE